MDGIAGFIELFLHLDEFLSVVIGRYRTWTYGLLFLVIFLETGFVVTPFLPGDSLLFAAGTFAGLGALDISSLFLLLFGAAVLGDTVNYWVGHASGPRVFTMTSRWFRREDCDRTQHFYKRHGGKTVFLARFIPIVRTFAPFVAGLGEMDYGRFLTYNVVGGFVWTAGFLSLGYFFGNIPFIRVHFSLVVVAIVLISLAPMVVERIASRRRLGRSTADGQPTGPGAPPVS